MFSSEGPVELLSKILRMAAGVFQDKPHLFSQTRNNVCGVCQRWRAVGLNDAILWSHLLITPRSNRAYAITQLQRSISSPLGFYFILLDGASFPEFIEWVISDLGPFFPRCNAITLNSPDRIRTDLIMECLSGLNSSDVRTMRLDIRPASLHDQSNGLLVPMPFMGRFDHLSSFSIRRNFLLWDVAPLFVHLQELSLGSFRPIYQPSLDQLLDLIRAAPLLVQLHLRDVDCSRSRTSTEPLATLPAHFYLTHLSVLGLTSGVVDLVGCLSLPSLHTLQVHMNHQSEDDDCRYLLISWRSLMSRVTTAIIRINTWQVDLVGCIMRHLSSVRRLDLRQSAGVVAIAIPIVLLHWCCWVEAQASPCSSPNLPFHLLSFFVIAWTLGYFVPPLLKPPLTIGLILSIMTKWFLGVRHYPVLNFCVPTLAMRTALL
ncbi:hypothetical protein DFH06DRAFT_1346793 [Mycena polygramma]|nr:hypothetical protein DFH06DRAFT_1346793 [Mycena polygramma]